MAIGKGSDFKIYHEQFFTGFSEVAMQNAQVFNGLSNNAIRLLPEALKGDYEQGSFVTEISNLITRRDLTSTAAVTDLAMQMGEYVGVKINRKIGPIAHTVDAFRKIAEDPAIFSLILGQQFGKGILLDYVKAATKSATAALANVAAVLHDYSGTGAITTAELATGLSKFGDGASQIKCWVMHSKVFWDLVKEQIAAKITNVADVAVNEAMPGSLNRPIIVTDAADLVVAGTPTKYYTLGLVENAILVKESEERVIESQVTLGLEQIIMRLQGEFAYNLSLKGFAWDIANGGANPADAAVATAGNWDKVATDNRSLAGVIIKTQ